jgi:hypothetical protein
MDKKTLSDVMRELGKRGGPARAKALSKEQRIAIATKASKAAAAVRKKAPKKKSA